jgi:hypothetical protein
MMPRSDPATRARRLLALAVAALVVGACGYIVTPADESSPTPAAAGGVWAGIATGVSQTAGGDLHVDLALRNDTGDWSALQLAAGGTVAVTGGDGKTAPCATAVVGTGGTSLAPGFQMRGYTGGSKTKPETKMLSVECAGVAPAAGQKLSIDYTYVTGDFNYYTPSKPVRAKLQVDLDKVVTDLAFPVAQAIDGVVQKATDPIEAINKCVLTLAKTTRSADGLEFAWHTENPTAYPTYVHIGTPPVIGADGVIYGFYESPHLADTPITPAKGVADWTTKVAVPKDVTGLYILLMVESKQQKSFVNHAIDITDQ